MRPTQSQIAEIRITPIAISDPPLLNAAGLHAPFALRIIVEIITRGNVLGLSEIPGSEKTLSGLRAAREHLIGEDVFSLPRIRQILLSRFGELDSEDRGDTPWDQRHLVHIFSAIEVACLDIMGKESERPIADILGGVVRERVPFAAYLFYKYEGAGGALEFGTDPKAEGWAQARQAAALDSEGVVAQAVAMCKTFGFQSIKLKGGAFEPAEEVEAIRALREAFGPEVPLRLDPNAIWKLETAIRWGKELTGLLEYYEDPVRGQEDMAALRQAVDIPLATNMCTTAFEDIPSSIRLHSEDVILSDHHFWGGLRASMELNRLCHTFGRGFSMHSNSHLGISLAAMVQLGAAVPHLDFALDTHYPWQADEVIVGGKMTFEEGSVALPKGPGLGVELDREQLARLHANYLKCGLTYRNDEIEMQKVVPDWKFERTRW